MPVQAAILGPLRHSCIGRRCLPWARTSCPRGSRVHGGCLIYRGGGGAAPGEAHASHMLDHLGIGEFSQTGRHLQGEIHAPPRGVGATDHQGPIAPFRFMPHGLKTEP
eukprot:6016819-Pyramimonas_sp.AAC.1